MNKRKLTNLFLIPLFIFSGCIGGAADEAGNEVGNRYTTNDFNIEIGQDWESITGNQIPSAAPRDLQVAFQANIKNSKFTANVNVTAVDLGQSISSEDFAKESLRKIQSGLLGYNELSRENVSINVGEDSQTVENIKFEGKQAAAEPLIRFSQIYVTNENMGYVVTAAYLPDEQESIVNVSEEMLKSFTLE